MKQFPKLKLISNESPQSDGDPRRKCAAFELVAPGSLSQPEQALVQQLVDEASPKAALLAVGKTPRSWDLRPVVTVPDENEPSVVRTFPREIRGSTHLHARVRETLDRLQNSQQLSSSTLAWGSLGDRIWYRRPFVETPLAHLLAGDELLSEERTLSVVYNLAEEVLRWHNNGVVHGHLTSSNIHVGPNGKVSLVDPGIGLALNQGLKNSSDYDPQSFAPEVLAGQTVAYSSDIYGLGLVYRRLFLALSRRYQFEKNREQLEQTLQPYIALATAMIDKDPLARPALAQIHRSLGEAFRASSRHSTRSSRTDLTKRAGEQHPASAHQGESHQPDAGKKAPDQKLERIEVFKQERNPREQNAQNLVKQRPPHVEDARAESGALDQVQNRERAERQSSQRENIVAPQPQPVQASVAAPVAAAAPPAHAPAEHLRPASQPAYAPGDSGRQHVPHTGVPGALDPHHPPFAQIPAGAPHQYGAPVQPAYQPGTVPPGMIQPPMQQVVNQAPHHHASQQQFPGGVYPHPQYGAPAPAPYGAQGQPLHPSQHPYGAHTHPAYGVLPQPPPPVHQGSLPYGYPPQGVQAPYPPHHPHAFGHAAGTYPTLNPLGVDPAIVPTDLSAYRPVAPQPQAVTVEKKGSDKGFLLMLGVLGAALVVLYYYRQDRLNELPIAGKFFEQPVVVERPLNDTELQDAWESKMPSRMAKVAEAALSRPNHSKFAEDLILSSVLSGDSNLPNVEVGLLRVAFDPAWEGTLREEDRRVALTLGLAGLLRGRAVVDLPSANELHPGVLLGLVANSGKNATAKLKSVRAERLTLLPQPHGAAFKELIAGEPNANCGDEGVQQLARMGTRAIEGTDEIPQFLATDTNRRLRALALMFSQLNATARPILNILLNHPALSQDVQQVKWGRDADLSKWAEIDSGDQLMLLAGFPPFKMPTEQNLEKILSHPNDSLRAFALKKLLEKPKFEHPGAVKTLKLVESNPVLLAPRATAQLYQMLKEPQKVKLEQVKEWTTAAPPQSIVSELLLATYNQPTSTELDAGLASYLNDKGWKLEVSALRHLAQHPDRITRLFAYNELYQLEDHETAREFLAAAQKRETQPDLQKQLELLLLDLNR